MSMVSVATWWTTWMCLMAALVVANPAQAANRVVVIPLNSSKGKPLAQVVTVSGKNGDFRDLVAAVNSITDASGSKPYVIVIGPGRYNLNRTLVMKPWVSIYGAGREATILGFSGVETAITGADNCELADLTVELNGSGQGQAVAMKNEGVSPRVHDVSLYVHNGGLLDGIVNVQNSKPELERVLVEVTDSGASAHGVVVTGDSWATLTDVQIRMDIQSGSGIGLELTQGGYALVDRMEITVNGAGSASVVEGVNISDSRSGIEIRRSNIIATGQPATAQGLYATHGDTLKVIDTELVTKTIRGTGTVIGIHVDNMSASLARTKIVAYERLATGKAIGLDLQQNVEVSASQVSIRAIAPDDAVGVKMETGVTVTANQNSIFVKSYDGDATGVSVLNCNSDDLLFGHGDVSVEAPSDVARGVVLEAAGMTTFHHSIITARGKSVTVGIYHTFSNDLVVSDSTVQVTGLDANTTTTGIFEKANGEILRTTVSSDGASLFAEGGTLDAHFAQLAGAATVSSISGGTLNCVYSIKSDGTALNASCQ